MTLSADGSATQPVAFLNAFEADPNGLNPPASAAKTLEILAAAAKDADVSLKTTELGTSGMKEVAVFFENPMTSTLNPIYDLQRCYRLIELEQARGTQSTLMAGGKAFGVFVVYLAAAALTALSVQLAVSSIFYLVTGNVLGFAVATNASIAIDSWFVGVVASKVAAFTGCALAFGLVTNWLANSQYALGHQGNNPEGIAVVTKWLTTLYQPFMNAYKRSEIASQQMQKYQSEAETEATKIAVLSGALDNGILNPVLDALKTEISERVSVSSPASKTHADLPSPSSPTGSSTALASFSSPELNSALKAVENLERTAAIWRREHPASVSS